MEFRDRTVELAEGEFLIVREEWNTGRLRTTKLTSCFLNPPRRSIRGIQEARSPGPSSTGSDTRRWRVACGAEAYP